MILCVCVCVVWVTSWITMYFSTLQPKGFLQDRNLWPPSEKNLALAAPGSSLSASRGQSGRLSEEANIDLIFHGRETFLIKETVLWIDLSGWDSYNIQANFKKSAVSQKIKITSTTPSCSGPIPARKSRCKSELGVLFSDTMPKMDFHYSHRFSWEKTH